MMSTRNDPALRLVLRSPASLQPSEHDNLFYAEKDGVPGAHCLISRYIEPPVVVNGSLRDLLPMEFYLVGSISCDNIHFESAEVCNGGTRTSFTFNLERRLGPAARIDWEKQIGAIIRIIRETRGMIRDVHDETLIVRSEEIRDYKIRIVDVEQRTAEVSMQKRKVNSNIFTDFIHSSKVRGTQCEAKTARLFPSLPQKLYLTGP